jgi:hypothetical protein
MKAWLSHVQVRQRPMLAVYAGMLVVIAVAIGVCVLYWLSSSTSDRLAVIGNFLSLGTLLLALFAGIVALAAFSAATGLPELKLQFSLPDLYPNEVRFLFDDDKPAMAEGGNSLASIIVENVSSYAARTPAVIIEFRKAGIYQGHYAAAGWTPVARDHNTNDILSVQWDGGPNYAIHGNSPRHLPELLLQGLHPLEPNVVPEIVFKLLADGYSRPPIVLPVVFVAKSMTGSSRPPSPEWL